MKNENRREFIRQAGTAGACIYCFGATLLISSCGTSKSVLNSVPALAETADEVSFPAASFTDKNFVTIKTKKFEEPLYVAKQADGSYIALRMYCPHKECTVRIAPGKFVCPCHGSEFSMNGALLKGPSKEPLPSFKVTSDSQNVIVYYH